MNIRDTLATILKRKRDAGLEVDGTQWLRTWTDERIVRARYGSSPPIDGCWCTSCAAKRIWLSDE